MLDAADVLPVSRVRLFRELHNESALRRKERLARIASGGSSRPTLGFRRRRRVASLRRSNLSLVRHVLARHSGIEGCDQKQRHSRCCEGAAQLADPPEGVERVSPAAQKSMSDVP